MKLILEYLQRNKINVLSKEETHALVIKAQGGCKVSKDKLITHNLPLVMQLAGRRRYAISGVLDYDDLFSEGVRGLMRSIEKFDVTRDMALSTYATFWINQRMGRFINDNKGPVRIPNGLQQLKRKYNKLRTADDKNKHNDDFYIRLLAANNDTSVAHLRYQISNTPSELYIDDVGTNQNGEAGSGYQLESIIDEHEINVNLLDFQIMIAKIGGRDREVIERRIEGFTLRQIAEVMNLSREMIRQIEESALLKLKAMVNTVKDAKIFQVREEIKDDFRNKLFSMINNKQIKNPIRIDSSQRYSPISGVCTECMFEALRLPENVLKCQQGQPNWIVASCDICGKLKPCASPKDFMFPVFIISSRKAII